MKTINHIQTMKYLGLALSALCLITISTSCNKDDDDFDGELEIEITDAPQDDANIEGTFVTVAAITLDGKAMASYEPQTIEISAYQNGDTKLLLGDKIEAGSYNEIGLVLSHEKDDNGSSPGTYVKTKDGRKHALNSSGEAQSTISFNNSFEASSSSKKSLVIDMDLRKSIKREENGDDSYEFVAGADFDNSFRIIDKERSGQIEGSLDANLESDETAVVYVYKKGTYNASEKERNSDGRSRYRNAESSTAVDASGNYTLAFLSEGEYEIKAAKYRTNERGESEFDSELDLELSIAGSIISDGIVDVNSSSTTSVNLSLRLL